MCLNLTNQIVNNYSMRIVLSSLIILSILSCGKESPVVTDPVISFTLTVTSGVGGSVSSPGGSYTQGKSTSVTATPDPEYVFVNWSNGSTDNPLSITVNSNQTVTANFEKRKYPLTVSITGSGTVSEEIVSAGKSTTEYTSGSMIRLTAIPSGDWGSFDGWSGDIDSKENSIEIILNNPTSINVEFSETSVIVNKTTTYVDTNLTNWDIRQAFSMVSGVFPYQSGDEFYVFFPGISEWRPDGNRARSKDEVSAKPSHILKRVNGVWEYLKTDYEATFWGARNFELDGNNIAIGDGNEIGADGTDWNGDAYYGKIETGGNILWTKVNTNENRAFHHGTTSGDINGDGLKDVGAAPGKWDQDLGQWHLQFFTQQEDGSFIENDKAYINYWDEEDLIGHCLPFALDFADLFGDARDEIIFADYGMCNINGGYEDSNQIQIYAYDNSTLKYEKHWESSSPDALYSQDMGATSIKPFDFNNDGIIDISVARESESAGCAFEIWIGNGNGTYNPHYVTTVWNQDEFQFREFDLLDVNNDGYMDIVFRPFHYGRLYRNNPVWWDVPKNNGIKFHNLIMINDGTGRFNSYAKEELIIENININNVHPYMDNGILHFVGAYTYADTPYFIDTFDFKVRILD